MTAKQPTLAEVLKELDAVKSEAYELRVQLDTRDGQIIAMRYEIEGLRTRILQLQQSLQSAEALSAGFIHSLSERDLGKVRRLAPWMLLSRAAQQVLVAKYPPKPPATKRRRGRPAADHSSLYSQVTILMAQGAASNCREALEQIIRQNRPGRSDDVVKRLIDNELRKLQRYLRSAN